MINMIVFALASGHIGLELIAAAPASYSRAVHPPVQYDKGAS